MTWTIDRSPCHCGERFATYQAHMAHADYSEGNKPICSDPRTIPTIRYDGQEWTHLAPAENAGGQSVRTAPKGDLTCRDCGKMYQRSGKRGRPPTRCEECR